jgi:hypothetical protein
LAVAINDDCHAFMSNVAWMHATLWVTAHSLKVDIKKAGRLPLSDPPFISTLSDPLLQVSSLLLMLPQNSLTGRLDVSGDVLFYALGK